MKTKRETRLERKLASGEQLLKKTKEKAKQRLDVEKQKHKTTKEGLKQLKHENRRLKQLLQTRDQTANDLAIALKEMEEKAKYSFSSVAIDRHHYDEFMVTCAVEFCVQCHCSLRSSAALLKLLSEKLGWNVPTPSYTTIKNWLEKSGYHLYYSSKDSEFPDGYAMIVDESMIIGGQKLLVTLGVPESKDSEEALTLGDVQVLDMEVKSSWNSEAIGKTLNTQSQAMGQSPSYVVSDNASTLCKAFREQEIPHLRDVGHTTALVIQHVYEQDEEFKSFMNEVSEVKFREVMRPSAHLLPPKQRTIARFMNLSGIADWASNLLQVLKQLSEPEQRVFAFLWSYVCLVGELRLIFSRANKVLKCLKTKGLSEATVSECLAEITVLQESPQLRVRAVGDGLAEYLHEEVKKLPDKDAVWHISSDVIESLFGYYKKIKSPNPLNGVTTQILVLPLLTRMNSDQKYANFRFKDCLEKVLMADIEKWKKKYLPENKVLKRIKILKNQHKIL